MIPRHLAPAGAGKSQEEHVTIMAKKKDSVLVAVLTLAERDGWVTPGLAGWLAAMKSAQASGKREIQLGFLNDFKPYDDARNALAKEFLDSGCDWLLMLDNDMIPPPNLLDMIDRADERMDILVPRFFAVSGVHLKLSIHQKDWLYAPVFLDRMGSLINLVWKYLEFPDGGFPDDVEKKEWIELVGGGSAAMFVRRRVFEGLREPFFLFVYNEDGQPTHSEDFYFCLKARDAGFRVWGNRQFEVDHMKTISLGTLARIFGWSSLADKPKPDASPETAAFAQPGPTANDHHAARVGSATGRRSGC